MSVSSFDSDIDLCDIEVYSEMGSPKDTHAMLTPLQDDDLKPTLIDPISETSQLKTETSQPLLSIDSLFPVVKLLPSLVLEGSTYHIGGPITADVQEHIYAYTRQIGEITLSANERLGTEVLICLAQLQGHAGSLFPSLRRLRIVDAASQLPYLRLFLTSSLQTLEIIGLSKDRYASMLSFLTAAVYAIPNLTTLKLGPGHVSQEVLETCLHFEHLQNLELVTAVSSLGDQAFEAIGRLEDLETLFIDDRSAAFNPSDAIRQAEEGEKARVREAQEEKVRTQEEKLHCQQQEELRRLEEELPQKRRLWEDAVARRRVGEERLRRRREEEETCRRIAEEEVRRRKIEEEIRRRMEEEGGSHPMEEEEVHRRINEEEARYRMEEEEARRRQEQESSVGGKKKKKKIKVQEQKACLTCQNLFVNETVLCQGCLKKERSELKSLKKKETRRLFLETEIQKYQEKRGVFGHQDDESHPMVATIAEQVRSNEHSSCSFPRLSMLTIYTGSASLMHDLTARISSPSIRHLSFRLRDPPSPPESVTPQDDWFVQTIGSAVTRWGASLAHVILYDERRLYPPSICSLKGAVQSLPQLPELEHFEIGGWNIDSSVVDDLICSGNTKSPKLKVLRLPGEVGLGAIPFSRLQQITEAFPRIVSLRCRFQDLANMSLTYPLSPSSSSHMLKDLSLSNDGLPPSRQQIIRIASYLDTLFPNLKEINTTEGLGHSTEPWAHISELVMMCQDIRLIQDERNRMRNL